MLLVPDRAVAPLLLGFSPFLSQALPAGFRPDPGRPAHGVAVGFTCMTLMVMTGVAGPLLDRFFLGGALDRREIVATKAACQTPGHTMKLVYFGALVAQAGRVDPLVGVLASMAGTMLAKRFPEGMTDAGFRLRAGRIVTAIGMSYIVQGGWLLLVP